jgi:ribonuclease HII
MPDLVLERAAGGIVAGVDEAGRGPLAGPVVAAAAVIDEARLAHTLSIRIDDSKKLKPAARLEVFAALAGCARIAVGAASVAEIDRLNILGATMLAMRRAVLSLGVLPDLVLIDGNRTPELPCPAQAIVGGDGRCLSIAAASIAAKVVRDRIMASLAARHPGFGWERNAGYGTAAHRAALARLGPTPHHRRSFAPVADLFDWAG